MDNSAARELIAAIMRGDSEAEKRFFEGFHHELIFFIKMRIGMCNPDAMDLAQDILFDVFRRIRAGEYDHGRGSAGAFIITTAKFKIMDYLKSRHHRSQTLKSELVEENIQNPQAQPIDRLIDAEEMQAFADLLDRLPQPHQTILIRYFYDGLKIHEIAAELGLDEQRVSNYKSYALTLMKKLVKNV